MLLHAVGQPGKAMLDPHVAGLKASFSASSPRGSTDTSYTSSNIGAHESSTYLLSKSTSSTAEQLNWTSPLPAASTTEHLLQLLGPQWDVLTLQTPGVVMQQLVQLGDELRRQRWAAGGRPTHSRHSPAPCGLMLRPPELLLRMMHTAAQACSAPQCEEVAALGAQQHDPHASRHIVALLEAVLAVAEWRSPDRTDLGLCAVRVCGVAGAAAVPVTVPCTRLCRQQHSEDVASGPLPTLKQGAQTPGRCLDDQDLQLDHELQVLVHEALQALRCQAASKARSSGGAACEQDAVDTRRSAGPGASAQDASGGGSSACDRTMSPAPQLRGSAEAGASVLSDSVEAVQSLVRQYSSDSGPSRTSSGGGSQAIGPRRPRQSSGGGAAAAAPSGMRSPFTAAAAAAAAAQVTVLQGPLPLGRSGSLESQRPGGQRWAAASTPPQVLQSSISPVPDLVVLWEHQSHAWHSCRPLAAASPTRAGGAGEQGWEARHRAGEPCGDNPLPCGDHPLSGGGSGAPNGADVLVPTVAGAACGREAGAEGPGVGAGPGGCVAHVLAWSQSAPLVQAAGLVSLGAARGHGGMGARGAGAEVLVGRTGAARSLARGLEEMDPLGSTVVVDIDDDEKVEERDRAPDAAWCCAPLDPLEARTAAPGTRETVATMPSAPQAMQHEGLRCHALEGDEEPSDWEAEEEEAGLQRGESEEALEVEDQQAERLVAEASHGSTSAGSAADLDLPAPVVVARSAPWFVMAAVAALPLLRR